MSGDRYNKEGKIGVAIFGAGNMAKHHIKAISLQENASVIALADPAMEQITLDGTLPRHVQAFADPERLLSEMKPDVVHVCTPPETHTMLSLMALRRGAHVYVEKPFTLSLRDAEEVVSLADASGLKVCSGHQLLYEEPALKAKKYLEKLGQIVHVESYFSFNPVRGSHDGRPASSNLDQLVDILPHPVYLLLHFMKYHFDQDGEESLRISAINVNTSNNVHAIFRYRDVTGNLFVTLEGRPIESYIKVIGKNGSLHADFVRGSVFVLPGPGTSGISKVINPYSQAWQTIAGTTRSLMKRVFKKQKSYPGLVEIIKAFYRNIHSGEPMDISRDAILETVAICEDVTEQLKRAEAEENARSEEELASAVSRLEPVNLDRGGVLITGGGGFLGRKVAAELRSRNWMTRVVSRSVPPASKKIPGVEYVRLDLGEDIPVEALEGISYVVHCAAETSGGAEAHRRNSIDATRNILAAMEKAGVKRCIHISSNAVLQTSSETGEPVDENTPLVPDSEGRGPYIWGKVQSEKLAVRMCKNSGIDLRIIRPGALVDFQAFEAPGRLGREVGPLFVCVGGKKDRVGLCDVSKAGEVIRAYVENFDTFPSILNLIEPDGPTNDELVSYLKTSRPDLRLIYLPRVLLRLMSPGLKLLQKIVRPGHKPIDIYAVYAPEKYRGELVSEVYKNI